MEMISSKEVASLSMIHEKKLLMRLKDSTKKDKVLKIELMRLLRKVTILKLDLLTRKEKNVA